MTIPAPIADGAVTDVATVDSERIMAILGDTARTTAMLRWMEALVEENLTILNDLVESADERRNARVCHLVSQISAFSRIKDACKRALERANGLPPEGDATDTAPKGVTL